MTDDHKAYIVFHPARDESVVSVNGKEFTIYHDNFGNHNQDPFIFNNQFVYTYCQITKLKLLNHGDIVFFANVPKIGGQSYHNPAKIRTVLCDLVFVVGERIPWIHASNIPPSESELPEKAVSKDARKFNLDMWPNHKFKLKSQLINRKPRTRYTYLASATESFQPKAATNQLFNIYDLMTDSLKKNLAEGKIQSGTNSQPLRILNFDDAKKLKSELWNLDNLEPYIEGSTEGLHLTGNVLKQLYLKNLKQHQPKQKTSHKKSN